MKIYDIKEKKLLEEDDPMVEEWKMIFMINPKILDKKR